MNPTSHFEESLSRRRFLAGGSALPFLLATAARSATGTESVYLTTVQRAADALLEHCRDNIGPRRTAMIFSVVDRKTLQPPPALPRAPEGVRDGDRSDVYGSNANVQLNLFSALQHLGRITSRGEYHTAADAALLDMIRVTQHPDTGLLAWGEHMYWDCKLDSPGSLQKGMQIHEPKRKFMFFDQLYAAEPARVVRFARGLWEHHIGDKKTGNFTRHARYDAHQPGLDYDFLKEAGYYIDVWSRTYEKTRDGYYLPPIQILVNRYVGRMNDLNLLDFDSSTRPDRENNCLTNDMLNLAIETQPASDRVDDQTAGVLKTLTDRLDDGFLRLPHDPSGKGFYYSLFTDTGTLRPRKGDDGHSRHWGMGYGVKGTMLYGVLCHTRYRQTGAGPRAQAYRKLFLQASDCYRRVRPDVSKQDIWAGEHGLAILLEIAAYRETQDREYLNTARRLADDSLDIYFDSSSPLPRASSRSEHYEALTYPDTLLLSLLAVHEALHGGGKAIEISDVDR